MRIGDTVTVTNFGHTYPSFGIMFAKLGFKNTINNTCERYGVQLHEWCNSDWNKVRFKVFNIHDNLIAIRHKHIELLIERKGLEIVEIFKLNNNIKVL
jgi:hypothetical protein